MKTKKTIKGMTLIEVIIAILVLGIAGTIMVKIATTSCSMMMAANHMNNKVEAEAPMAAAQEVSVGAQVVDDDLEIEITGSFDASSVKTIKAKKYTTSQKVAGNESANTSDHVNADLIYYSYEVVS